MEEQIIYREGMSLDEFEKYFDQRIKVIEQYNKAIANTQKAIRILRQNQ